MISKSKILAVIAGIAAIILVGVGLGFFLTRAPGPVMKPVSPPSVAATKPSQTSTPLSTAKVGQTNVIETAEVTSDMSSDDTGIITNWDDRLDDILTDKNTDTDEKAKAMLKIFPRMPEAGQAEAVRHLSNLLRDEDYAPLGRYLADPKTAPSVLDELMTDVLNRPNSMKLPLLLEVARDPNHPKAAEAKETLAQYLELDEDIGSDWNQWQEKVNEKIKEDPD